MAMVVQHNITAMNSSRQLGIVTNAQSKTAEKLSSGYRINRAGDDAAGLKISEKMRSQIRGLQKASTNAQDGVSLIQTAEGALNEAHSILQRMNELAVQGANDTNVDIDRDAINEELEALTDELDRIAKTTQFNKQNLLDGTFTDKNLQVGANANQNIEISIKKMDATALGLRSITTVDATDSITSKPVQSGVNPIKISYNGMTFDYNKSDYGTMTSFASAAIAEFQDKVASDAASNQYALQVNSAGSTYYIATADATGKYGTIGSAMSVDISAAQKEIASNISGALADYLVTESIVAAGPTVAAEATTTSGTAATTISAPNVDSFEIANRTLEAVQEAINTVSSQRSALGALQNRLEHTIANLDNVAENTQAAESRIRDTDMAAEMVEYSKNNILAQAGQSMLAQANQSTQGVLSLLQ